MKLFLWGVVTFLGINPINETAKAAAVDVAASGQEASLRRRTATRIGGVADKDSLSDPHISSSIDTLKESMRHSGIIINSKFLESRMISTFLKLPMVDKHHVVRIVTESVLPKFHCCSYLFNWVYHPSSRGADTQPQILEWLGVGYRDDPSEEDIYKWVEFFSKTEKKDWDDIAAITSKHGRGNLRFLQLAMPSLMKLPDQEEREDIVHRILKYGPKRSGNQIDICEIISELPKKEERDCTLDMAIHFSRYPYGHLGVRITKEIIKVPYEIRRDVFLLINTRYPKTEYFSDFYHDIVPIGKGLLEAFPDERRRQAFISLLSQESSEIQELFPKDLTGRVVRHTSDLSKCSLIYFLEEREGATIEHIKNKVDEMINTKLIQKRLQLIAWRTVSTIAKEFKTEAEQQAEFNRLISEFSN